MVGPEQSKAVPSCEEFTEQGLTGTVGLQRWETVAPDEKHAERFDRQCPGWSKKHIAFGG